MAEWLGYPFDPELFLYNWENEKDPTLTAMFDSGAVVENGKIAKLIANGSDFYTIPFYNVIGGDPVNYDGQTDILIREVSGKSQNGIVWGRANAWKDRDFVNDFNSGADPMKQITSQVAKYWQKRRQELLLAVMNGIFNIATDGSAEWDAWQLHTTRLALTASGAVSDANRMGETTIGDAIQKAVGDASGSFRLAVMHSYIANRLAGINMLNYWKYTDQRGIERRLNLADINGLTVVIDDGVPAEANATTGQTDYTTYLFGDGAIHRAKASVENPVEIHREPADDGGYDALFTRIRETIHPNGFSFVIPSTDYTHSPTNAQLGATGTSNWKIAGNPKNIAIARVITNG